MYVAYYGSLNKKYQRQQEMTMFKDLRQRYKKLKIKIYKNTKNEEEVSLDRKNVPKILKA